MNKLNGHILAFMSVFFWSALYVSVKILLDFLTPFELLVLQFIFGYIMLLTIKPKILKVSLKEEIIFAIAGLCGISIYNLFLNLSMEQTYASNVSIIIATAPLFTGIFAFILKIEKPYRNFFIGFALCIVGIGLLSFGDSDSIGIKPLGDLFALVASMGWGAYSVIIVSIMNNGYDIIIATRKIIFYGILFLIPGFFIFDFSPKWNVFLQPMVALNFIFVVFFASGFCFVLWNKATLLIGAVKTNIYVYLTPIITIIVAILVLDEKLGFYGIIGVVLTLLGVIVGEYKNKTIK